MINVVNNTDNEILFEKVAVGDVFLKDGVAYIKIPNTFKRSDLVDYLEYDVLDNVEELDCDICNAVMLRSGTLESFDVQTWVEPVEKATLTLNY